MRITVWTDKTAVDAAVKPLVARFLGRLPKVWRVEIRQYQTPAAALESAGPEAVLLDEDGIAVNSEDIASFVGERLNRSEDLDFIFGPTEGFLPAQLKGKKAWSLSPLTFTRDLALLVFAEQLYRAHTILANHPYHKK